MDDCVLIMQHTSLKLCNFVLTETGTGSATAQAALASSACYTRATRPQLALDVPAE